MSEMSGDKEKIVSAFGGKKGLIDAGFPALVFLISFNITKDLWNSLIASIIISAILTIIRLVMKDTIQHALSGFIGTLISAWFANKTGNPSDVFVPKMLTNLGYGFVYLIANVAGWPILGVMLGPILGENFAWRKDPARPGIEAVENPVGVDAPEPERHHIRDPGHPLLPLPLPPPLKQLRPLPRSVSDNQARAMERSDKPGQFLDCDPPGRKPGLESLLELLEARLPVEHLKQRIFLGPEPEVVQRDRVFDDEPGLPLIELPRHLKIAPLPQADRPCCAGPKGLGGRHGRGPSVASC